MCDCWVALPSVPYGVSTSLGPKGVAREGAWTSHYNRVSISGLEHRIGHSDENLSPRRASFLRCWGAWPRTEEAEVADATIEVPYRMAQFIGQFLCHISIFTIYKRI